MLMSPVAMIADSYVAHQRLAFHLHNRNSEGKRSVRAVYPTTVAKGLLHEVVTNLEPHFICTIVSAIVRNRSEITARQNH